MAAVRGKFKVSKQMHHATSPGYAYVEVTLEALCSQTPEDNSYATATPSGTIHMVVTNQVAIDALKLGSSFYVDFTPVEG